MQERKSWLIIICLILLPVIALTSWGCSSQTTSQTEEQQTADQNASGTISADRSKWPGQIRIGGASVGGMAYVMTATLAQMIQEFVGVPAIAEETTGPGDNLKLVDSADEEMGIVGAPQLQEAWEGIGWSKDKQRRNARVMFPAYPAFTYITVLADSPIYQLQDLQGKKLGFGGRGGTVDSQWPKVLEIVGIEPVKVYGSFGDLQGQLADGIIDAMAYMAAIPYAAQLELEAQHEARIIVPTEEVIEEALKRYPGTFSKGVMRAGTYPSVKEDLPTLTQWMHYVAHKDLPEDLVYQITKSAYEHKDYLKSGLNTWPEHLRPENILDSPIPLHSGAIKYYKETGVDIPQNLVPPEMAK